MTKQTSTKKRIFQKWQNLLYFSHLARKPWPQPYPPVASQPELNFPVVWRAGNPFTESHPAWGLYIWRLTNWWELWNYCFSCKYTFCPWKKISIQYIRTFSKYDGHHVGNVSPSLLLRILLSSSPGFSITQCAGFLPAYRGGEALWYGVVWWRGSGIIAQAQDPAFLLAHITMPRLTKNIRTF